MLNRIGIIKKKQLFVRLKKLSRIKMMCKIFVYKLNIYFVNIAPCLFIVPLLEYFTLLNFMPLSMKGIGH